MTVLQCGACDRFISVSLVPGGNPVALADPKRWSLTRRVCAGCGRSLCDQCAPAGAHQCPVCRAALPAAAHAAPAPQAAARGQPAPDAEDDEDDAGGGWRGQRDLVEARRWLLAAAVGTVLLAFGVFGRTLDSSSFMTLAGAVVAMVGAFNGVQRLARNGVASRAWFLLVPVAVLVPWLGFFLLAWLAWRAHARLAEADAQLRAAEARRAARERAARRAAAAQPAAAAPAANAAPVPHPPAAKSPTDALQAIACVKTPGVDRPDGTILFMQLANGMELPKDQQPVLMAYKGFGIVFLIDEGQQFRYANHAEMAAAGMTPQALLQAGLRNLAKRVNGAPGLSVGQNGAFHALLMGGHFEASLLLLDDLWEGPLKPYAPRGFVVALPARDICAFCDVTSAQGIEELRALAASVTARGDHCITPQLYTRQGRSWAPLQ